MTSPHLKRYLILWSLLLGVFFLTYLGLTRMSTQSHYDLLVVLGLFFLFIGPEVALLVYLFNKKEASLQQPVVIVPASFNETVAFGIDPKHLRIQQTGIVAIVGLMILVISIAPLLTVLNAEALLKAEFAWQAAISAVNLLCIAFGFFLVKWAQHFSVSTKEACAHAESALVISSRGVRVLMGLLNAPVPKDLHRRETHPYAEMDWKLIERVHFQTGRRGGRERSAANLIFYRHNDLPRVIVQGDVFFEQREQIAQVIRANYQGKVEVD